MKKKSRIAIILAMSFIISILPVNVISAFGATGEAPSNLQVDEGWNGIYLFWDNIDRGNNKGLNYYELYVKAPGESDYELLSKVSDSDKDQKDFWQSLDPNKTQFRYIHRPTVPGTYYYKLRAVYVDAIFSELIYGDIDYAALENPKIKASALNGSSIKVSWNKIKNADGYYIYKTVKSTRRPFPEVTIASGNTTSWIDKDIKKGVKYEYQVIPYIYVDGKAISNMGSDYVTGAAGVAKAKITSLTTSAGSATIKWSKLSNANGYEVFRAESASGTYKKIKTAAGYAATTFTDQKKTYGKTYYYKVRAYTKVNGTKYYGDFSSSKSIKISSKTLTQRQARKAYLALKNQSLYFPSTLIVNKIYSGKINGQKVIMIDYSAENAYGIRTRDYFTYWPSNGYWNHDYSLLALKNKVTLNKSKIIHWN